MSHVGASAMRPTAQLACYAEWLKVAVALRLVSRTLLLRNLLRMAHEEWELLATVPKIRLEKEPQGRIRWLEPDEETRLLAACAESLNRDLLASSPSPWRRFTEGRDAG
jgi:hypothetical protein